MHPLKKKKKRILAGRSLGVAPPVFGRGGRRRVPPARKKTPPPPPPPPEEPYKPPPVAPPPPTDETWDAKALREWKLEQALNEGGDVAKNALLNYSFDEKDMDFAKAFVKEHIEPSMAQSKRDHAEEKELTWTDLGLPEAHLKWVPPEQLPAKFSDRPRDEQKRMMDQYNEKLRVCVAEIEKLGDRAKSDAYVDPEPKYDVQDDEVFSLIPEKLREKTKAYGISQFFPIQRAAVPLVIAECREMHGLGRDVAVSAPTGSGKTLIYALGVLTGLHDRRVPRVRGVIVVPSRELARQVHAVFELLVPAMEDIPLRICLAAGQPDEQVLIEPDWSLVPPSRRTQPAEGKWGFWQLHKFPMKDLIPESDREPVPQGGIVEGQCDVIIATPGRLVDLVQNLRGFTLQHARYLIVDEADRLLDQSYQDWAQVVLDAMHQNLEGSCEPTKDHRPFDATTRRPYNLNDKGAPHPWYRTRLSKFLFSATLGDDPQQLNAMKLSRPLFIYSAVVDGQEVVKHLDGLSAERFFKDEKEEDYSRSLPAGLAETAVSCDAASKPLTLFALLERERTAQTRLVIVFCNATDTVTRLAHLAQLWSLRRQWAGGEECILAMSSAAGAMRRDAIIKECRRRLAEEDIPTTVLIASDALARGVDLPSVALVINYDAPRDASNYVHRVGRAARAGASGRAVTLIKRGQDQDFDRARRKVAPPTKVPRESVGALRPFIDDYKACLSGLEGRLGTGRKLRQPTGGFARGFLDTPAPAPRSRSSSSEAPAPAPVRSRSSSSGFRRGFLG